MADADLLDAREAMQTLGITENELQNLVARGDLRAFRSAGTMKFRRDDVLAIKADKGTEPTIIIPAAAQRKGSSGILPTVPPRPGSRVGQAVPASGYAARPPAPIAPPRPVSTPDTATSDIVLEDIELMPTDDQHITQQVTVAQPAVSAGAGGATVAEPSAASTGEMTVVESGPEAATAPAAPVTASGRRAVTGSGRAQAAPIAPPPGGVAVAPAAMSRVRPAAAPGVSIATSRRTQAVYQAKSASPWVTVVCILNSLVLMIAAGVVGVMMSTPRCDYDPLTRTGSMQRVIPPFMTGGSWLKWYDWCYENTPGRPEDKDRPKDEFPSQGRQGG